MLDYSKSFIETQFPVSKISKESYKERKAGASQTLTGIGKWWGRKPLVLVRAVILGALLPVSDDPIKDREIFLKLMTMDNEGLLLRKTKSISAKDIYMLLTDKERVLYFDVLSSDDRPIYKKGISKEDKDYLQTLAFNRLSYDDKIVYCDRPEHINNLAGTEWDIINKHLETQASSYEELVSELGVKRFGHKPKVGDCFSGGGSIPFESSRLGVDVYASDLNPIATLLTWASINSASISNDEIVKLGDFQQKVYKSVELQIKDWGIELNSDGHRADAYLYCNESVCPECGFKVPLAPSWIIGRITKTVAILKENSNKGFDIEIIQGATAYHL